MNFGSRMFLVLLVVLAGDHYVKAAVKNAEVQKLATLLKEHSVNSKSHNTGKLANTTLQLAGFYESNGFWKEAAGFYKEALKIHVKTGDLRDISNVSIHLAYVLRNEGENSDALAYAASAARLFSSLGRRDSAASSYVLMANLNREMGNYHRAESLILNKALRLYGNNALGRVWCFRSLGNTYMEQRRYSEAKWFFIQENMQSRKLHYNPGIISSLLYLAKVKTAIKDYNLALKDLGEAGSRARNAGDISALAGIQRAFAAVHRKLGNSETASRFSTLSSANASRVLSVREAREKAVKLLIAESEDLIRLQSLSKPTEPVSLKVAGKKPVISVATIFITLTGVLLMLLIVFRFVYNRRSPVIKI